MGSSFTWLDYSEADRRRALDTIDLFRERDTRDALGLGSIRDGFADLLSPGTSTIQTRARYFLLIPWLHQRIEKGGSRRRAVERARSAELKLIEALIAAGDLDGLIGSQARSNLKRLPSDVYWQGLQAWGVRPIPVAREAYYRWIDAGVGMPSDVSEEGDPVHGIWHAGLPEAPAEFPAEARLTLETTEAEYLTERLVDRWPDTMITWLVRDGSAVSGVEFPWLHPDLGRMPTAIQQQLDHGRCFSEVMLGAQRLYNFMLARRLEVDHGGSKAKVEIWRDAIDEWEVNVAARAGHLERWDLGELWHLIDGSGARVTTPTRRFINTWVDHVRGAAGALNTTADKRCGEWIRNQEHWVKGNQARLVNPSMLLTWRGQSGSRQLDYRWGITRGYVEEIGGNRGA